MIQGHELKNGYIGCFIKKSERSADFINIDLSKSNEEILGEFEDWLKDMRERLKRRKMSTGT